jgi:hypothetical protein
MKKSYFKFITLFLLLFCFSANIVSAIPLAKPKTYLNEAKEIEVLEKNLVEEKLAAINGFNFHPINSIESNANHLKVCDSRFALPMSYYSIPDRPPKR